MTTFRCPCGAGTVAPLAKAGRTVQLRGQVVPLPAELAIPTCDSCGEEWVDRETAVRLDAALAEANKKPVAP